MRFLLIASLLGFFSFSHHVFALPRPAPAQGAVIHTELPAQFAQDRVLVKFQPGMAASEAGKLLSQYGLATQRVISGLNVHVLEVPVGTVLDTVERLNHNPNILYAEPDYYRVLVIPNEGEDPPPSPDNQWFKEQYALNNTGQVISQPDPLLGLVAVTGANDADIDAPEGWDTTTGSADVKIAILDTGIDCRTAARPGGSLEFAAPGKCVEEVNFVTGYSTTVDDVVSHGSHVAGIAAAATNNDIGIAGVGWSSSVGSLKACFEYYIDLLPPLGYWVIVGICPVSSSAAAITYAADQGYHVINMSYASDAVDENGDPLGLGGISQAEQDAVNYAWDKGVVVVAAAGNNNDTAKLYPAAYDKVIAVGATDRYDDRASFSTFGSNWVSLLAPGDNIISTVPNELCVFYAELLGLEFDPDNDACLDWYSGTSMASPHVAGAAALVWAHLFPAQLTDPATCVDELSMPCNERVRQQLEGGADTDGALGQNMLAWSQHGRLNVAGALGVAEPPVEPAPSAPSNVIVNDLGDGSADVFWVDTSNNETRFDIFRESPHKKRPNVWVGFTQLESEPMNTTTTQDTSGVGTFRYCVSASNTSGSSDSVCSPATEITDSSGGGGGGSFCESHASHKRCI
jgi:hypothetical protein